MRERITKEEIIELKKNPFIQQWLNYVSQGSTGSERTEENYLRGFAEWQRFAKLKGYPIEPNSIIHHAKQDLKALDFKIAEFLKFLEQRMARSSAVAVSDAIRSFLTAYGFKLPSKYPRTWRAKEPRIPTKDEIKKFMEFGNLRLKAQVLFIRDSGLSKQDLANLRYGDIREGIEAGKDFIHLRLMREKEKTWFDTFIGPEAVNALRNYLSIRKSGTEKIPPEDLNDESPLWRRQTKEVSAQTDDEIECEFVRCARRSGLLGKVSPHLIRKYFNTTMKLAGVNDSLVEYWMGHTLPRVKSAYLVPSIDEQMKIYQRAYLKLSFQEQIVDSEELRKKQVLDTVKLLGFSEDKIKRVEEALAKYKTVDEAMNEIRKLSLESYKHKHSNNDPKKVIKEDELENYINEGWDVQTVLPSGRILIKLNSS